MTRTNLVLLLLAGWSCTTVAADVIEKRDNEPYIPKRSVFSGSTFSGSTEDAGFAAKKNRLNIDITVAGNCLVASSQMEMFSISELNVGRPGSGGPFILVNSKPEFPSPSVIKEIKDGRLEERSTLSIQIVEELARDMESIDEPGSNVYHKQSPSAAAKAVDEKRFIMEAPVFSETGYWLMLMLVAVVLTVTCFYHTRRLHGKLAI